ncbi:MAG: hypothetical protein LLF94_01360 [Chlamydiales bacterium]|nr:hypothetical protein [Chlamydiales bacterium]
MNINGTELQVTRNATLGFSPIQRLKNGVRHLTLALENEIALFKADFSRRVSVKYLLEPIQIAVQKVFKQVVLAPPPPPIPAPVSFPEAELPKLPRIQNEEAEKIAIQEKSLLRNIPDAPPARKIDHELIRIFSESSGDYDLAKLLEYCDKHPTFTGHKDLLATLKSATTKEQQVASIIAMGKTEEHLVTADAELLQLAKNFALEIGNLTPGQSQYLPYVLRKEAIVGQSTFDTVMNAAKNTFSQVKGQFKATATVEQKIVDSAKAKKDAVLAYAKKFLPESICKAIEKSLLEDLKDIFIDNTSGLQSQEFAEKLWDSLSKHGVQGTVEKTITDALNEQMENIQAHGNGILQELPTHVPLEAQTILSESGYHLSHPQGWLHVEKQPNNTLTVTLYAKASRLDLPGTTPLVIENIPQETLDSGLIYRLLSFNAWPAWNKTKAFTYNDFCTGFLNELGTPSHPKDTDAKKRAFLGQISSNKTSQILGLIASKISPEPVFCLFTLKKQALLDGWATTKHHADELHARALLPLAKSLFEDAKKLRAQNLITALEYEKIEATYLDLAMIEPPEKIGFLDALKPGSGITSAFPVIKEVVKEVLGDEAEKTADVFIQEATKFTSSTAPSLATTISGSDWKDITGVTQVNRCIGLIKNFRLSLYHSVRLLSAVLSVVNHRFIGSLLGFAVHLGLVLTVPGYALLAPSFYLLVSKIVIQYGIQALYTLLPSSMANYLQAASSFIQEIKDYFYKRIKLAALKTFIYFVVDPKTLQSLISTAKSLQQTLIKEGQLSFDLPNHKIASTNITPTPVVLQPTFYVPPRDKPAIPTDAVAFTPDVLDSWLTPFKDSPKLSVFYLIEKISSMPIPVRGQPNPVWDNVKDIQQTIVSLDNLAKALSIRYERDDTTKSGETIAIHALYAVVDYLARKDPASHMADLPVTHAPELMRWTSEITTQVPNQTLYNQLQDIAAYFEFDANKRYTEDEVNTRSRSTLFHQGTKKNETYKDLVISSFLAETLYDDSVRLYHSRHSRAYQYYKTLAEDPQIQQRMTTPADGNDFDKIIELYSDPITATHPEGILPQSFRTLRLIDTLAHNVFRNVGRHGTRSNPPSLHFKKISKNTFFAPLLSADAELRADFSGMVKGKYRTPPTESFAHDVTTQLNTTEIEKSRGAKFLMHPGVESQNSTIINILQDVQAKDKLFFTLFFSTQEKINLELITSNKSDMLVRTLAFFKNFPEKLLDKNCRKLFSVFLLNAGALQLQLQEHPAFAAHINDYFMSFLDNPTLNQNELVFNYLIEQVSTLEALHPGLFPHFKSRLRQEIDRIGRCQKSSILLSELLSTLRFIDIAALPRDQRNQALLDISRYIFSDFSQSSDYIFHRWKSFLFETAECDISFRKELLSCILKRPLQPGEENVDIISLLTSPVQHNKEHEEVVKATAGYVQKNTLKLDLKDTVKYGNTGVSIDRKTGQIFLEHESKKYILVTDASFTANGSAHWLETGTSENRRVLVTKDTKCIQELFIDKKDEVKVPLDTVTHNLGLLSWICPLSQIEAFCTKDAPEKISRIVLPNVDLRFESRVVNGQEEMVSTNFNNFYIKRDQKLPALSDTPQYLVLENHKKEQIVLIPKQRELTSTTTYLSNTLAQTALPHFITKLADQIVTKDAKTSYYVYSVNKSGALDSNDAQAIANRVLHYVSTNTPLSCKKWLQKLEDASRIHPFTDDVYEQIHMMMVPLLGLPDAQWLGVGLKLAAISRNNALLHNHSRRAPFSLKILDEINGKADVQTNFLIFWTLLQLGYTHYLGHLRNGAKNILTPHEELLLLHEIGRVSSELVGSKLPNDDTYLDSIFEPQLMLEQLAMSPEIVHRYQQIKHDLKEPITTREAFNYFLYLAIQAPPIPLEDTSGSVLAQASNALDRVQGGLDKATGLVAHYLQFKAQNPVSVLDQDFLAKVARVGFAKITHTQHYQNAQFHNINILKILVKPYPDLKNLTLSLNTELNASFASDFLDMAPAYFCLATRRAPKHLTEQETAQFLQKSDRFRKNLGLLVGKYNSTETELINLFKGLTKGTPISDALFTSIEKYWYGHDSSIVDILKKDYSTRTSEEKVIFQNARTVEFEITGFVNQNLSAFNPQILTPEIRSHFLQKFEYWKSKGASKMAQDAVFYGTYLYNPISIIGYTRWAYNLLWAARTVVNTSHKVSLLQKATKAAVVDSRQACVPEQIATHAQVREQHLNTLFSQILNEFFDISTVARPSCTQEIRSYPVKSDTSALDAAYNGLNQSINDFANREADVVTTTSLKNGKKAEDLIQKIDLLKNEIVAYETKTKKDIEEFVNDRVNRGKKRHELHTLYTFDDIENAFIRGLETTLVTFTDEELTLLQEKLYLYQITHSRIASLVDCKDVTKIGSLLARRRVYTLDKNQPEKWLRAKLAFESRTGHFLWKKPMEQLQKMLFGEHKKQVLELIMASGKTFYGIPTTDYMLADADNLLVNIWPAGLAPINTQNIGLQSRLVFDTPASSATIVRQEGWEVESVMALYRNLKAMRHNSGHYNMTQSDAQATELKFLELCLLNKKGKKNVKTLIYLKECVKLLRTSGVALPDEAHDVYNSRKELNYPFGKPKILGKNLLTIMNEVMFHLANSPHLALKGSTWHKLPEAYFHEKVKPLLADSLVKSALLELSVGEQAVCKAYITGELDYIPDFVINGPHKKEIALVKGMFEELLPHILGKIIDVDFCKSENEKEQFAKPSVANMSPQKRSVIQNPFEAYIKTCMMALRQRIDPIKMLSYLVTLKTSAQAESAASAIRLNATKSGKIFASFGLNMQLEDVRDLVEVADKMVASDRCTLEYVKTEINPQIRYFPKKLSSNAQNFASMFSSFYADTGTPYNHGSFPEGTHVVWDKGTLGETIELLQRKCASADSVQVLKSEAPLEVLSEMLHEHFGASGRTICDRGALFRGIDNHVIAQNIMQFITKNRTDLQGVVFYLKNQEYVLEKGSDTPIKLEDCTLPKEQLITYFDQYHTFGANVPQADDAECLVTVGEDIMLAHFCQAVWRMRGLKTANQTLKIITTKKVVEAMNLAGKKPTIDDIITFALENEAGILADDNFHADKQKLHNFVRRRVLDKILAADSLEESVALVKEFEDFFCTTLDDDPFSLYGKIKKQIDPLDALKEYKKELLKVVAYDDLAAIEDQFEQFTPGIYPEKVSATDSGLGLALELDNDQNEQQIEEMEQQQNLQQDLQQDQEVNELVDTMREPVFWPWSKQIDPTNLQDWLTSEHQDPPLFGIQKVLKEAESDTLKELAPFFSPEILSTNNFTPLINTNLLPLYIPPFGTHQKPIFEVLIITKDAQRKILLLDQKEAKYWRKMLAKERQKHEVYDPTVQLSLYDITLGAVVAAGKTGHNEVLLNNDPIFQRSIAMLKFLNGDLHYNDKQAKALGNWIQKCGPENMHTAFLELFHDHQIGTFSGSHIETLLAKKQPLPTLVK